MKELFKLMVFSSSECFQIPNQNYLLVLKQKDVSVSIPESFISYLKNQWMHILKEHIFSFFVTIVQN